VLGSKEEYDKLIAAVKKKPAVTKTLVSADSKVSAQGLSPTPETDPRGQKPRPIDLRQLGVEIVAGKTVELKLGETHVLLLQRLGESMRITSARRTPRTLSDALVLGGTVIVPRDRLSDVCDGLREAAE
jgi:hypothetical protein